MFLLFQVAAEVNHVLLRILTKALFGDELAANYLLFNLTSSGKIGLNLFSLPNGEPLKLFPF